MEKMAEDKVSPSKQNIVSSDFFHYFFHPFKKSVCFDRNFFIDAFVQ